jgi:hypothetical protein
VNRFVEECRREWRRLRVPDAIANEMAADLAADLAEAEAEGASAEDVLGDAVFDARSFAASWAEERGVVATPATDVHGRTPTALLVAGAFSLVIALIGATLLVGGRSGSSETRLAFAALPAPRVALFRPHFGPVVRPLRGKMAIVIPSRPALFAPAGKFVVGGGRLDDSTGVGGLLLVIGLIGTAVVAVIAILRRRPRFAPSAR